MVEARRRTALAWLALTAGGCGSDVPKDEGATDTGDEQADTTPQDSDEALLRSAIAGESDAATALATISWRGGLPVETDDGTHLFACLCGPGSWALAGDHDGWSGASMARTGDLSWIEVQIPSPDGSRYKFTDLGDVWTPDPLGRRYGYDEYGEYSLVAATQPHLERWHGLEGHGLGPRNVQVWVPEGGAFTHALYAHDGQNLFDPGAIWGGWGLSHSVPDGVLVIGIDNTDARIDEYTHVTDFVYDEDMGGSGAAYADLVGELRTQMESHYGAATTTGLMGSSLGGLISFYIAHVQPDQWDMAISLSGTMGWGSIGVDDTTMLDLYAEAGPRSTALYLDSGGAGTCVDTDGDGLNDDATDGYDNYCENRQFADLLADLGYTWEADLWHWHEPGAEHNEQAWAARVWRPMEIFASLPAD